MIIVRYDVRTSQHGIRLIRVADVIILVIKKSKIFIIDMHTKDFVKNVGSVFVNTVVTRLMT